MLLFYTYEKENDRGITGCYNIRGFGNHGLRGILWEKAKEWLQFVVTCRLGLEHDYDIVEGPMADDTIWDYVEDYMAERISKEAFWELVRFKYPTHQIVFCTERALQTIKFEGSYSL